MIALEGSGCDKRRNIKNFVKSQPLFDVHRQYLYTFLIDLHAEVSSFCCRIFHCFAFFFSKFSSIIIGFYLLYPLVFVLYLESFENNVFELDFSISKKRVSTVKPSQKNDFFCTVKKFFFQDSSSFPYIQTLLKVSDHVFEKNPT